VEALSGDNSDQTIEKPAVEAEAIQTDARARFDVVAKEAPQLREYLDHHRPYYQQLKSRSLVVKNT
jgi:hypothetical protein